MDFAISSPKLGLGENVPAILLSEAFLRKGSVNVHEREGEYRKIRGRLAEFYDITNSEKIALPTDVYTITAIDHAAKKLTVTGDVLSGTTALADGATIRINGGTTEGNNITFTVNGTPSYSNPNSTVYVAETISAEGATPGNLFVGATPAIRYHRHVKENTNTEYILVGTGYHIFLWTYSDRSLTVKHTCASVCSRWEMCTHIRNVYATNNVDKVVWWDIDDSAANSFAVLDNANGLSIDGGTTYIVKARHICSYEKSLMVGYVTDSDGEVWPQRVIGADLDTGAATIDFQYTGGSGQAWKKDFYNTPAFLMGFAKYGNNIIVGTGPDAKTARIYRGWLTTQSVPFEWHEETLKVGPLSADTFCNSKDGRLFFLASDMTVRELNAPESIAKNIEATIRGLNTEFTKYAQATFIDQFNSIALAVPSGSSETNNKLLMIDVDKGTWFEQDIPVRCFGSYTQQAAYTYDTLPYATYADWGADWLIYDTDSNVVGFGLDIVSDYSGNTYSLFRADKDAGAAISGNMIFATSLDPQRQTLNRFKRVNNGIDFWFNRENSGSVTVEEKRDHEAGWRSVGSVSLVDADLPEIVCVHIPYDTRAKFFEWQLSSDDYFELIRFSFSDFILEGTR